MSKKLKDFWNKLGLNKFGSRYFLLSILIFTLSILTIFVLVYRPAEKLIIKQDTKKYEYILSEWKKEIDNLVKSSFEYSQLIYYDANVYEMLASEDSDYDIYAKVRKNTVLKNFLYMLLNLNENILMAAISDNNQIYYDAGNDARFRYSTLQRLGNESKLSQLIRQADGKAELFCKYDMQEEIVESIEYISVGRQIKDYDTGSEIGLFLLDIDLEAIFHNFIESGVEGDLILISANGENIYSTCTLPTEDIESLFLAGEEKTVIFDSKEFLTVSSELENAGWRLVYFIPYNVVLSAYTGMRNSVIVALLGVSLITIIVFGTFSKNASRRITKLIASMKKFRNGDLSVTVNEEGNDEFTLLMSGFNDMSRQVKDMVEREKAAHVQQKEAEKSVLRHQINPHFIYNSLESIQMFAILNEKRDIAKMVAALGKLLRIGLSGSDEIIELSQELDFVRSYLHMQEIRFGDKFSYEIHAEEEVLNEPILKFILQPTVENAVMHGIEGKKGKGFIYIEALRIGNKLRLTVEDNGVGIQEDELKLIQSRLKAETNSSGNIGLKNVFDRIKLFYGEDGIFSIESSPGKGTKIILNLPPVSKGILYD